jgi:serine/threonine-protein kinase HipA
LVVLYGEVTGHLERVDESDDPSFTYDRAYVDDGAVALSARMPLQTETFPPERVAPYLQGLIPENSETRDLWARRLNTLPDDAFGMLAAMGWDCPGAVQFCRPEEIGSLSDRASSYKPLSEADIAARLRLLTDEPASWTMPDEHWSLGGQQEKFALAWRDDSWHEAHGAAATTHILKPGIRRLHHQALIEHVTMAAAASVGVDVATTRLMQFEDQWAIVIDRFDRQLSELDGAIHRFHQEDMCQALGRLPQNKYESRGGPSLANMMRVVRQQSTGLGDDRLALADFLIINLVAGAPDGHSKNVSMLRTPERTWIAPLYDLATGLVYDTADVDRSVALSIGGERRVSRIGPRQWARAARTLGLPYEALCARAAQLTSDYPAAFAEALTSVVEAPGADEVADRTVHVLKDHAKRILAGLP